MIVYVALKKNTKNKNHLCVIKHTKQLSEKVNWEIYDRVNILWPPPKSRSGILPALSDSSYAHPNPEPPLPPQVTSKFTSLPLFVVLSCKRASLDDARAQPSKF